MPAHMERVAAGQALQCADAMHAARLALLLQVGGAVQLVA